MRSVYLRSRERRLERRQRRHHGGIAALPLAVALIAVLLLQLVLQETANVTASGGEVALAPPLSIRLDDGRIILERAGDRWRRELRVEGGGLAALTPLLDSLRSTEHGAGADVILIASRETPTSDLLRVIEGVRLAGFPHISLYAAPPDTRSPSPMLVDPAPRAR